MARSRRQRLHHWVEDACSRCGLRRREVWILDESGRAVMALVWSEETGDVRVQPFPLLLGLEPPTQPVMTRQEAFGDVPIGPEPPCLTSRQRALRDGAPPA